MIARKEKHENLRGAFVLNCFPGAVEITGSSFIPFINLPGRERRGVYLSSH